MRYAEIFESRPWKHYSGRTHAAHIAPVLVDGISNRITDVEARFGLVHTGRSRVFHGYFVEVSGQSGEAWTGEHRYSLRGALRDVARKMKEEGWSLSAIGLSSLWHETGLTGNSGYGYHPDHDGAVMMLEPLPNGDARQG
jgi:hypothetical protein